jgi:ABC-type branched-subunit amino acid transport system substrate-binding protein
MADDGDHGGSRRTFLRSVGAAGGLTITGLAGCTGGGGSGGSGGSGGNGSEGGGGGNSGSGGGSGSGGSYKIGVTTSLSGPFAVFGQAELDGAKLAAADLESELGVDVELIEADTEVDPSTGLERTKRLVTEENVDFTMGGVSSAVALKMGTWASDNGVVYMPTGAHSNAITGDSCAKYMFRPTCSNSMLADTIGNEMANAADSWFLMYSDYTWGQTAQQSVTEILRANDKQVVGTTAVPFPSDDYTPFVNEAKATDADGIGVLIAGLDMRKALQSIIDKGVDSRTLAMHQMEDVVYWGLEKEIASVMDVGGQVWGPATEAGNEFKQRVAEQFDTDPYVRHFLGYLSADQLVRAAERAGSRDPEAMRSALEGHEISSPAADIKGGGPMYWRECDHQLIQSTYNVRARPVEEMAGSPYKTWFETTETFAGDDVARACEATGCQL